jgi:protein gp37
MNETPISWADLSWNPVSGCTKVEPPDGNSGCTNCYAARLSQRWGHTDQPWTPEHAEENVTVKPEKLEEPYSIDEPAFVFVNSMSDLFHSQIPDSFIREVFAVMRNCPHIIFQILTKRPGRATYLEIEWPENVWMGTSVEDNRVVERLDLLRECAADTLFVSFEPLIGPVGEIDLTGYDWAIVGGESAPDADRREMDHAWARAIYRDCCQQDVAFYFKQSSARKSEQGTALTVYNADYGIYEQREIRETPDPAPAVHRARQALTDDAVVTAGGER